MKLTAIRERVAVDVVRWAPKGLFSAAIGWGARRKLPRQLRAPLYRTFAQRVGARLDEVELPLEAYPSFGQFFARRLRPGVRPLPIDANTIISPCDGRVAAIGLAEQGRLIQVKGKDYSLTQLVGDEQLGAALEGGTYFVIYLSPADYHRVHAPITAKLLGYDYVPGTLFPVNPLFSRSVDQLMARNERVVFHLNTCIGTAALVMVAALGVSNLAVTHDRRETRHLRPDKKHRRVGFNDPVLVGRGEELGAFHLGSTTIAIFEPSRVDLGSLRVGDAVRFGQPMGRVLAPLASREGS